MTQAVAEKMLKAGSGRVINIVANMWRGFREWPTPGQRAPS